MTATSFFGLLGCGLLCLASIATALRLDRFPVRVRHAVAVIAAVAVFVPVGDLSVAAYVRGATGDLSAPTLALAASACVSRIMGRSLFAPREGSALLGVVAAAALFLYPFALGFTPFDPYALGYASLAFATILLLVTLAAWRAGLNLVVLVVVLAAVAYLGGVYESRNLWDYLIDPLVAFYALARLGAAVGRTFLRRQS
jgi:hypothetical protein